MGDDGFFSVGRDLGNYLFGKKKGGFSKYDRVVDRTLDQIPDQMPTRRNFGPVTKTGKKRSVGYAKSRTYSKKRKFPRSYKPKKIVRKKYKKTTAASYGLIDVSRRATAPKGHVALLRRKTFGDVQSHESSKMAWIGTSDIGQQSIFCQAIAQAILMKYLSKIGDHRTDSSYDPQTIDNNNPQHNFDMFHSFQVKYAMDAFNEDHATAGLTRDHFGNAILNGSIQDMVDTFGTQLRQQAENGRYPTTIAFYRDDFINIGSTTKGAPRVLDNRLGEHYIDIKVTTILRLHNISPSEENGTSIHDINANPIQGKVYTFRNQRPKFTDAYQENQVFDPTTRDGMETLNKYKGNFDIIKGVPGDDAFAHLERPPLNPRSLWDNSVAQGTVLMSPGAYRTYNCKFARTETVKNMLKGVIRVSGAGKNPPIGSSVMMCFQPSMRNSDTELVKLSYDYTAVYNCAMRHKKSIGLPVREVS